MDNNDLDELIDEAIIDCYGDYEEATGFAATFDNELQFPFKAKVVGENVDVLGIEIIQEQILVKCRKKNKIYYIDILDLEYNKTDVTGNKWIEAYRKWKGRN